MKIKLKISLWSNVTVLLMFLISLFAYFTVSKLMKATNAILHSSDILEHILLLEKFTERLEINLTNYTLHIEREDYNKYQNDKSLLVRELNYLEKNIWTENQKVKTDEIRARLEKWLHEADKYVMTLSPEVKSSEGTLRDIMRLKVGDSYLDTIRKEINTLYSAEKDLMLQREKEIDNTLTRIFTSILISFSLIFIIYSLISHFISKGLLSNINRASFLMEKIANGSADLTNRIQIKGNDEISEFIKYFNVFIENLQILVGDIKKETALLDEYSSSLSTSSISLANTSVSNSSAIKHMNSAMEDLRQESEVFYKKTSDTLSENEKNIEALINNSKKVSEIVDLGGVKTRFEAVSELLIEMNKQSSTVAVFISELKEISTQSRILSVNTSVQASKAGEYGKVFSVIANEIKNLSGNSDLSIKNATNTFRDVQNLSQQCAIAIDNMQNNLFQFMEQISFLTRDFTSMSQILNKIAESIQEITESKERYLEGIRILSEAMNSIKDSTAKNAEGAKKLETASSKIYKLSGNLKEKIESFKT